MGGVSAFVVALVLVPIAGAATWRGILERRGYARADRSRLGQEALWLLVMWEMAGTLLLGVGLFFFFAAIAPVPTSGGIQTRRQVVAALILAAAAAGILAITWKASRIMAGLLSAARPADRDASLSERSPSTRCPRCGNVYPSRYYFEDAHDAGSTCSACARGRA